MTPPLRHAYLILAHNQWELLELLISSLDAPQNDIYLHIDAKVKDFDFARFQSLPRHSRLYFSPRVRVVWGGYSQVQSEYALFRAAAPGKYDYYHLLSGVDLPLRSPDEISAFFEEHKGKEFIHFSSPAYCQSDNLLRRVRYFYPFQESVGRKDGFLALLQRGMVKTQRILRVNRLKNKNIAVKCGANWCSVTHGMVEYLLEKEDFVRSLCGKGFCVDEVFLQTVAYHSPFRQNLYLPNDTEDYRSCLRYVDWKRGTPYVFTSQDYEELKEVKDFLFARKFDYNAAPDLCEKIARSAQNPV